MNNYLRKEVIKNMFYVGIILAFAAICTYFIYNKFQTTRDVDFNSKSLEVVFHDSGNNITINKVTPMTDSVGLSSNAYSLSIKNNLVVPVNYKIKVIDDVVSNLEEGDNVIYKADIRISVKSKNDIKIYDFSELEDGLLLDEIIDALGKEDITIRAWVKKDSNLPIGSDMKYHGKIQVFENDTIAIR